MAPLAEVEPEEQLPEEAEVVGEESAGRDAHAIAARIDALLAGELRRHGDWKGGAPRAEVEPGTGPSVRHGAGRVRLCLRTACTEVVAGAFHMAGARRVTVRLYPDAAAREAWTDFGRKGFALPEGARAELVGALGPRPRLLLPLVAAGVVALALERLSALPWFAAALLFGIMGFFAVGLALAARRNRIEWVRLEAPGAA